MRSSNSSKQPKNIVEDTLGPSMTRKLWTSNYAKALPFSVQDFALTSVLPAVFYMFRFGYRRGKGNFAETFGDSTSFSRSAKKKVTISQVTDKLAATEYFEGFGDQVGRAILGDLLLTYCLENVNHKEGRTEQVQRVAPVHYMSSWIDLPEDVGHLRFVPETIVAMLANQEGEWVTQNAQHDKTWFAVGGGFDNNALLRVFSKGITIDGHLADHASDRFDENTPVGLDQLLMIRMAQQIGKAPEKLRGGEGERISNQRPIAERAADQFSEDIRVFIREYGDLIPRHAFVDLLESCIAIGLTTIVTSVIEVLFEWAETGEIRKRNEQTPTKLFADCSNGVNHSLRGLAEQSMDDFTRRIDYFPVVLMALRLLDWGVTHDRRLGRLNVRKHPCATEWLNLLGEILLKRRDEANAILYDIDTKSLDLANRLEADTPEVAETLRNEDVQPSPVWRMAEALTLLQGRGSTQNNLIKLIDSVLLTNRSNGLAAKRKVARKSPSGSGVGRRDVRSLVLTDSTLDYLVHLLVLKGGRNTHYRPLSFKDFLIKLHDKYGICVDIAPPHMRISNELLRENRNVLEHRLRDLGLLAGVNDAEAMKYLRPRFIRKEEDHDLD